MAGVCAMLALAICSLHTAKVTVLLAMTVSWRETNNQHEQLLSFHSTDKLPNHDPCAVTDTHAFPLTLPYANQSRPFPSPASVSFIPARSALPYLYPAAVATTIPSTYPHPRSACS